MRYLEATCENYEVKINGKIVSDAVILSEGKAASTGFLILNLDKPYYIGKVTPDLKSTIQKVDDLLDLMNDLFSALTTSFAGGLAALDVGVFLANTSTLGAEITSLKTGIESLRDNLK
jgi:hypothetical protein